MIYAASPAGVEERRRAFFRKCRLKCKAIADSFEEAAERLFTFTRLRAVNGKALAPPTRVERLYMEFKCWIKTQAVLPPPRLQRMLFWALLASGQIPVRQVDGWQSLTQKLADKPIDLAA